MTIEKFLADIGVLIRRVEMIAGAGSDPSVPADQYELTLRALRTMRAASEGGQLPPTEERHANLARLIADGWPLGHKLGAAITEIEYQYQNLEA